MMSRPKWVYSKTVNKEYLSEIRKQFDLNNLDLEKKVIEFQDDLKEKIKNISDTKKKTLLITKYLQEYFEDNKAVVFLEVKTEISLTEIKEKFLELFKRYGFYINQKVKKKVQNYPQYNLFGHKHKKGNLGFVDMRIVSKNKVLDIEIDSTSKKGSILKLLYSKLELGYNAVWIRHTKVKFSEKYSKILEENKINLINIY